MGTSAPLAGAPQLVKVQPSPAGALGFDANTPLTSATAAAFYAAGYRFVVRYLSLTSPQRSSDLSASEMGTILSSGLALMAVQHVRLAGWVPSANLGQQYGHNAAANAMSIGLPAGMNLWLDLEGIAKSTPAPPVIDYCNAWCGQVESAGFVPGLYVGDSAILDGNQLYESLSVSYYWQSGSKVPPIANRGYCMIQTISKQYVLDGVSFDRDVIQADNMGNTPLWATY